MLSLRLPDHFRIEIKEHEEPPGEKDRARKQISSVNFLVMKMG